MQIAQGFSEYAKKKKTVREKADAVIYVARKVLEDKTNA